MQSVELDQNWDREVGVLGGGILQSSSWAHFQASIGRAPARGSGDGWLWQAFERRSKGIKYLISPYGPIVQQNASEALQSIIKTAQEHSYDFVRIEPVGKVSLNDLKNRGSVKIKEVDPEFTSILDLTKSEDELRKGLSSGHRNEINGTERRGIIIESTVKKADIDDFLGMLDDTANRSRVVFYKHDYYRKILEIMSPDGSAKLYLARADGQAVASAIFYDFKETRYYAHAGAYQDLNRKAKASVSLVWRAILDAKQDGLTKFDFWGIAPDDDPNHAWAGITKFKNAFGGDRVATIGTWDIPLKKTKYKAYQTYRKLKKMD